jgi:hypothetical protein
MSLVEGYPELNMYALTGVLDNEKVVETTPQKPMATPAYVSPRPALNTAPESESPTSPSTTVSSRQTPDTPETPPMLPPYSTHAGQQQRLEVLNENEKSLSALEMQLQKTKLCKYHQKGVCKLGSNCCFAHSSAELVKPPNLQKTRMCPALLNTGRCNNPVCTFAHHDADLKQVNVCHKTMICKWYLAGKCRNGKECSFAHGDHELKGNAKDGPVLSQKQKLAPTVERDNVKGQRKESMFRQTSMEAPMPFVPALHPPPGFMPYYDAMQPYAGYEYPAHLPLPPVILGVNDIHVPPPMAHVPPPMAHVPPPMIPPMMHQLAAADVQTILGRQDQSGTWQLTELAVQINMLSEEVKRLQDFIVPPSTQSTNSGSSTRLSSGQRTPPSSNPRVLPVVEGQAKDEDPRTLEEKVKCLQSELKRVIVEGQRCGKIRQYQ